MSERNDDRQPPAVKPDDEELSTEELEGAAGGLADSNGTCPINHNYVAGCGGSDSGAAQ